MKYLINKNKSIQIIEDIEKTFNVNKIIVDELPVWNFLRHHLFSELELDENIATFYTVFTGGTDCILLELIESQFGFVCSRSHR